MNTKKNEETKTLDLKEDGKKKKYLKPEIISEDLNVFGASCNGSLSGGRKSSTGTPNFCNANKLNS
ncbi:hypothetical protein [Halobacteriovorax sp. HLS]|uniref:hypothetical protein n=1 Tax=Halobacteriovorax sp. HLS TaxID=2234000 RepID=UPI000FDBB684|nr:hypothetical protein [Halobacteriovorax sp. HLS]